jgi:hypothetical protein
MSLRFDRAQINSKNVEKLPDGRLRVRASFSKVGPLNYLRSDGTLQTEHLTADELFKSDSLETAGLAAVTLGHPPEGMVTPKNWRKYNVGASGSEIKANRHDGLVSVVFVVGDEEAIEAIEQGKATEVSAGYSTTVEQRADGQYYQTNRIYNHLALVERGRAGPDVRLHLDADDDWAVMATDDDLKTDGGCENCMKKYKGMEVDEKVYDAFMEEIEALKGDMKAHKAKKDSLEADRIDALEGENAGLKSRIDSLTAEMNTRMDADAVVAEATARMDAFAECQALLPEGTKFDATMSPIEWRKAAIAANNPNVELNGRSDDYVNGMFSAMQAVGSAVVAKTDAAKADDFRRVLDQAATAGHSGKSLPRGDADDDTRQDADDIAAINSLFAPKGGAK